MSVPLSRRGVIVGAGLVAGMLVLGGATEAFAAEPTLLRPPGGQDEIVFRALCIDCDRCRGVCPTSCIVPATADDGFLVARTPKLDFHRGPCTFCARCRDVCPTGALEAFEPYQDKIGVAVLDTSLCIAYTNGSCDKCRSSCSYGALTFDASGQPSIASDLCNGCGSCVDVCVANVYQVFNGSRERAIEVVREGTQT
jgi:ferredoxin-type protein NapG